MKDINDLGNPIMLKELFKQLFENSSDPLFITHTDFKFTEVNAAFENLFEKENVSSKRVYLVDLFEDDNILDELLITLEKKGVIDDYEVTLKDYEGDRLHVLLSLVPINDEEGELIGYQGVVHDQTDRVIAQRALQRAQRITMTGRMLRTIAHEIRNPLTNVDLAIASIMESDLSEDDVFMVDLIQKNSTRINDLLTELLDTSKPAELELKTVSLQQVVKRTIKMAEDRMNMFEIQLEFIAPEQDVMIQADMRKTTLALNNILINAIEVMPDGGLLSITILKTSKRIRLSIADTGMGIEKEDLGQLFDLFFSLKTAGTGLGLTATQTIIQSHGWHIHVDSKLGVGTVFHINIPVKEVPS